VSQSSAEALPATPGSVRRVSRALRIGASQRRRRSFLLRAPPWSSRWRHHLDNATPVRGLTKPRNLGLSQL